jgi:hypothetical protein
VTEPAEYCREVETYLCRKNDGHLIRIAGPAFDRVCGWAAQGVPLAVVFRGIDRTFERYYRKGERRRPVRVEFCEADILDAFDEWRRAVGITLVGGAGQTGPSETGPSHTHESLPAHLNRAAERLTSLVAQRQFGPSLAAALDGALVEIDALRSRARALRGAVRGAALDRLRALDAEVMAAARVETDAALLRTLTGEAEQELSAFAGRMPADAHTRAVFAARDRLLRERLGLPAIALD